MNSQEGFMSQCALGDILELQRGYDLPTDEMRGGCVPVAGSNGIIGYHDIAKAASPAITVGRSGSVGSVHIYHKSIWPHNTSLYVSDFKGNDPSYLYYMLSMMDLKKYGTASVVPSLNRNLLYPLNVRFHKDLAVQRKIGEFLSSIDRLIQLSRKRIENLEKLAKEIYDYWFVQFDFPDKNGKPYKTTGGKMVYNPQLKREIPEGWEVCALRELIGKVSTGLNPRDNFKFGGDIKYLTVKNLSTTGRLDLSNCDYINEEALRLVHARSDISEGDILFASIEPLGRCYLIQEKPTGWDINESVFSIRPNFENVCSEYLYHFFMSEWFVTKASRQSVGSIFKGIRIAEIMRMEVLLPRRNVVEQYGKQVRPILRSIDACSKSIHELAQLREFLLPLLMNGQAKMGGAAA